MSTTPNAPTAASGSTRCCERMLLGYRPTEAEGDVIYYGCVYCGTRFTYPSIPAAEAEEVIIERWLAEQEGMPPGDVLGAAIVRSLRAALLAARREVEAAAKRAKYAEATLDNIRFTTSIEGARQLADNYFAGRAALAATQEEK